MFTGIVEDVGCISRCADLPAGRRIVVATSLPAADFALGESIAIAGACMTVVERAIGEFAVDVSAESLRRTILGELGTGDAVNLERAMQLGDRLGGHMVSGHIDGTGTVDAIRPEGESSIFTFRIDRALMPMLVEKGSVAVDGISLTCFHCRDDRFDVAVIPHTLAVTTLGSRTAGSRVNIEVDVMGKYVARLVDAAIAARLPGQQPLPE
ncbi:MAG: riboflavin synthase [Candidatus Binatia bacterium]